MMCFYIPAVKYWENALGKGAKIGANCVVSFDVPPYVIVTAPKPTIHIKEKADNEVYI